MNILSKCGINPLTRKINNDFDIVLNDITIDEDVIINNLNERLENVNYDKEVQDLLDIQKQYTKDERYKIAHKYDNIYNNLSKYITKSEYKDKIKDLLCILLRLKYKHKEPRPKHYSNKIDVVSLLSAKTPRYPSGHSAQYHYLYLCFKDRNSEIKDICEMGSKSRLIAGVHFPIDVEAGKWVAKYIYDKLH